MAVIVKNGEWTARRDFLEWDFGARTAWLSWPSSPLCGLEPILAALSSGRAARAGVAGRWHRRGGGAFPFGERSARERNGGKSFTQSESLLGPERDQSFFLRRKKNKMVTAF